jgi:ABC-2 type transport system ATP-binding protein
MITVQNLTKYYSTTRAVNNLSFEVEKGEILGLLGPNGAGKTTTLRILTGYLKPTSGTVDVEGLDIVTHALQIKRMIGYLPESAPLYTDLLVYDYLLYIAAIRGLFGEKREGRIKELASLCGIKEVMHRPIGELSKGYKQRVGLTHAMMSDPEILILDEPTSGLDPNQIVEIRSLIKEIGKEKTVILSTHILSEVEATCDRIVIINRGELVADGTTQSLRSAGEAGVKVWLTLLGTSFEEASSYLSELDGVRLVSVLPQQEQTTPYGQSLRLQLDCDGDVRIDIYRRIKEREWILLELTKEKKSLENIFRELTLSEGHEGEAREREE